MLRNSDHRKPPFINCTVSIRPIQQASNHTKESLPFVGQHRTVSAREKNLHVSEDEQRCQNPNSRTTLWTINTNNLKSPTLFPKASFRTLLIENGYEPGSRGINDEGFRQVLDKWTSREAVSACGEGFEGVGGGVERIEDEETNGHAKGVERVVRQRDAKFILSLRERCREKEEER
ncbi:hypothetical protein ACSQ67_025289 [Phaseolus vulgaris]